MRLILTLFLFFVLVSPLHAQEELFGLSGMLQNAETGDESYSWQLEYLEELNRNLAFSISYLNEGHLPSHHRDGHTLQLWARTSLLDKRYRLSAGIGPFHYFDTTPAQDAAYANEHGWGAIMSLAAAWHLDNRWIFQLRTNLVETADNVDTVSAMFGIGYELTPSARKAPVPESTPSAAASRNELTVYLGRTIVNSLDSEHSVATALEYRRRLWHYVDGSLTWLYEGDNRLSRRNGLCTQLWGVKSFLDDRLSLGAGGGLYFRLDHYQNLFNETYADRNISGIVTLTASYRIGPVWALRASWNRIVTSYNSDTDVLLGGIGYRF